jgi:tRNA dimethylallyltransferase
MPVKKYLIVIGGPTASGKTTMAIRLAQHFSTEILSADSRQFYREMSIGTAKPSLEELSQARHHFIDNLSIHDPYSVGDFEKDALSVLNTIYKKNNMAIMVGGTGLYIQAVCEGLDAFPEVPIDIRQYYETVFEKEGIEALQKELQILDNEYFMQVDKDNSKRLIRALSVCKASGQPFSSFRKGGKVDRNFDIIYIYMDVPRDILYQKINNRVDKMLAEGLINEVEKLLPYKKYNALQTVGYTELFAYFAGEISLDEAIDKIKQHTRNYAKRQMTWFRRAGHWVAFSPDDTEGVIRFIDGYIKE